MKILHTVHRYYPHVGGSEELIQQISEALVRAGHQVTVATTATRERTFTELNGVKIVQFDCNGNAVNGFEGDTEAYRSFLRNSDADVMLNYSAQIWCSDLVYDLLPSLRMKKILVPCGFSELHNPAYKAYYDAMPDVLRTYDKVVYHSGHYIDKEFGDRHGINNAAIVPNGANASAFNGTRKGEFRRRHGFGTSPVVINVSNHSNPKGHDFFWKCVPVLKQLGCASVLIGNSYRTGVTKWLSQCYAQCNLNSMRYSVPLLEGYPRQGTLEAFVDADIFLFGSILECAPLVMYEAFASRTLFITKECGNVRDHEDIACIVKTPGEAIGIVEDYCAHPERYSERIERGYNLVQTRLNWNSIALEYLNLYDSLLRG